jgi:hypothetical protein
VHIWLGTWELARKDNFENSAFSEHGIGKHASVESIDNFAGNMETHVHLLSRRVNQDLSLGYVAEHIAANTNSFIYDHQNQLLSLQVHRHIEANGLER